MPVLSALSVTLEIEHVSDMDPIDDYAFWTPTNYGLEDTLANWGPSASKDFAHSYEINPDRHLEVA